MFWQLIVLLILLIPLLAIVLDSRVGQALAARLERDRLGSGTEGAGSERLAYLEGEVDRLSGEITRLSEESEFLHKLLTEKAGGPDDPPDAGRLGRGSEEAVGEDEPPGLRATPGEGERHP